MKPRIIYIQYTNPAGYPPLEHSSRILADRGYDVWFLGAGAYGADSLVLPDHPAIRVTRLVSFGDGILAKLNYAVFVLWSSTACLIWRPRWIYASEAMAAPPARIAAELIGARVVYHEHDSPTYDARPSLFQRLLRRGRQQIGKSADVCILPQQQRLLSFVGETLRTGPSFCVWNCPRSQEVSAPRAAKAAHEPIAFYFHGSLNEERLPPTIIDALTAASTTATLTFAGYETVGSQGYVATLLARAQKLGIASRVTYIGTLASRRDLLSAAANADVGLSFMPIGSSEINMANMAGASNKPFDYMAVGLALLVSDLEAWKRMFVDDGYALACNPGDVDSLRAALAWYCANPEQVRAMGERGRQRIVAEWNYERQFAGVAEFLTGTQS